MARHRQHSIAAVCLLQAISLPSMCAARPGAPFHSNAVLLPAVNSAVQQAATPAAKEQQASRAAPSTPPDVAAQIDELTKQSFQAINVKVNFQRAVELAQQALELSEKAGDKIRAV